MKNSSKLIVCCVAAVCLLFVATAARAQTLAPMKEVPQKQRQFSLLFGLTAFIPGDDSFGGGVFGFQFMPNPKHILSAEIGGGIGPSDKIAEYEYDLEGGIHLTDGEVMYDYNFMQFLLTWNRVFNPSGKWQFRIGPSIGLLRISGKDEYSPTTYHDKTITGLPKGTSERRSAFTGGVVAGVRWNISQKVFLDLNYMLSGHTSLGFEQREVTVFGTDVPLASKEFGHIANRINLTLGLNLKQRNR